MVEVFKGWQCIGCGKIDVDGNCIGICQDRSVRIVLADEYETLLERNRRLESVVRRLIWSRPCPHAWEESFKALQAEAIRLTRE